jgi:hypothetical protein
MPNPIVELVEKEMAWFDRVLAQDRTRPLTTQIFPDKDNLYPMPFFGDIRRAEVLTVALNPAHTEFDERQWPSNETPTALSSFTLTSRLLHYFDLPEPEPHPFFKQFSQLLQLINCSYARNASHVDLSSLPTFMPTEMAVSQRPIFVETVQAHVTRLNETLRLATNKKLILVVNFRVNDGMNNHMQIWETLCTHCPLVRQFAHLGGELLPILKADNVGALTAAVLRNRHEIREHLASATPLVHPNHE